jgi:unsaturated rhamnogalacturonyl hydrolase
MKKVIAFIFLLTGLHGLSQEKSGTKAIVRSSLEKNILLDYYFNNEYRLNAAGQMERFHYTWEDTTNSGYSLLGDIFRKQGANLAQLKSAPSAYHLKNASVYIIVDPDTDKETVHPNYVQPHDVQTIFEWVNAGGILLLLLNDSGNAEFAHVNQLAGKFGIHFNENCINKVTGTHYETGAFVIQPSDTIFKTSKKIYIKELSGITISKPAKAHFVNDKGEVIMAIARSGKGTVFAVGDPWFYNEYLDGRKLPAEYENYKAANDLVVWLLQQVTVNKK